jgi:hypothetical protein
VQIANLNTLEQKKDAIARYRGLQETLDWMYASPEAVARYVRLKLPAVRAHARQFIPKRPAD